MHYITSHALSFDRSDAKSGLGRPPWDVADDVPAASSSVQQQQQPQPHIAQPSQASPPAKPTTTAPFWQSSDWQRAHHACYELHHQASVRWRAVRDQVRAHRKHKAKRTWRSRPNHSARARHHRATNQSPPPKPSGTRKDAVTGRLQSTPPKCSPAGAPVRPEVPRHPKPRDKAVGADQKDAEELPESPDSSMSWSFSSGDRDDLSIEDSACGMGDSSWLSGFNSPDDSSEHSDDEQQDPQDERGQADVADNGARDDTRGVDVGGNGKHDRKRRSKHRARHEHLCRRGCAQQWHTTSRAGALRHLRWVGAGRELRLYCSLSYLSHTCRHMRLGDC